MSEELVPPDFMISPEQFEENFCRQDNSQNIHQLAMDGKLHTIHNRFICWRMFLGILPKNGPLETWEPRINELRTKYWDMIAEQRVIPKQKVNVDHLDPLIFNPLSQANDVSST